MSEVHEPHSFDCSRALSAPYVATETVGIEQQRKVPLWWWVDGREPLDGHWVDCQVLVGCSEVLLHWTCVLCCCAVLEGPGRDDKRAVIRSTVCVADLSVREVLLS